jgi:hypothetical protein
LFSEISKNWAAEPLDSYEKMLKFIRTTSTQTGLVVTAYLDRKEYPTGLKPDPQLISSLRLRRGNVLPRYDFLGEDKTRLLADPLLLLPSECLLDTTVPNLTCYSAFRTRTSRNPRVGVAEMSTPV